MAFVLATDSNCDMPAEYYRKNNILMMNMHGMITSEEFVDDGGDTIDIPAFYERLREGESATTTQITTQRFVEAFGPVMEGGSDIVYICFSSALSATYQSACIAAEELRQKYQDRTLYIVDSLCASGGQGLLVHLALAKRGEGMQAKEIADWANDMRHHIQHWFTPSDLNFLKRGGRVSAAEAFLGTMLDIKPVLHVSTDGRLVAKSKVKGRKKALRTLAEKCAELAIDPRDHTIIISHADAKADAEYVAQLIREHAGPCEIILTYIGPVIGAHAGPDTIALFFYGKARED